LRPGGGILDSGEKRKAAPNAITARFTGVGVLANTAKSMWVSDQRTAILVLHAGHTMS
jgi:hypothetical protein